MGWRAHPHEGLQSISDAVLLGDGLQAQPHLRHGPLVDGDDAVPCACTPVSFQGTSCCVPSVTIADAVGCAVWLHM